MQKYRQKVPQNQVGVNKYWLMIGKSDCHYFHKIPKYSDTPKIAVIILKCEQLSFTVEKCIPKLSTELQTV